MNIWDWSKQKLLENEKAAAELDVKLQGETVSSNDPHVVEVKKRHESHIIVCGSKRSGKSSFQQNFLERKEDLKESVGLEYSFARRTRGNVKDISHLWELGGGTALPALFSIPLTAKNIEVTSIFVVVDTTHLEAIWSTIESLVEGARRVIEDLSKDPKIRQMVESRRRMKMEKLEKEDLPICNVFPLNLTIVASKYDEFQNFEPEKRRSVCAFLRFIAHYYGANLIMYSSKMDQFAKIVKNVMSHCAFGTVWPQGKANDFNKPMFINATSDSFVDIGMPPGDARSLSASSPFQLWKETFQNVFPKKDRKEENEKDPMTDPLFREPAVDELVEMKRKELENEKRQKKERDAAEQRAAQKIAKMVF